MKLKQQYLFNSKYKSIGHKLTEREKIDNLIGLRESMSGVDSCMSCSLLYENKTYKGTILNYICPLSGINKSNTKVNVKKLSNLVCNKFNHKEA
jgi:hypothetical protein